MRYEDVLKQAVEILNKKIGEGVITRGASEDSDEHDDNSEQITRIIEEQIGGISDADILQLAIGMPEVHMRVPSLDADWDSRYEMNSPMALMRENLYEIMLDDVWEAFEGEEDANEEK